jgi:hypothetical protein
MTRSKERSIEWLLSLSPAQFNSATFAPGNTKWRASLSDEQKAEFARKLSIANKGKVRSQETRNKISLAKLGKPNPRKPGWVAPPSPLKGKPGVVHTEATKLKISIANKGRLNGIKRGPQSDQTKEKYLLSKIEAGLTTRCQTPLGIFRTRAEAARAHGVDPVSISNWMRKEKPGFFYLDKKDIDKCKRDREEWLNHLASKPSLRRDRSVKTPLGDFPSIRSAAKAIGIDQSILSDRIKRDWNGYAFINKK